MSNFAKNVEDASEAELMFWINNHAFNVVHLASDEVTRRRLKELEEAVNKNTKQAAGFAHTTITFNTDTSRQTGKLINLTWAIVVLTITLVAGLVLQIYLTIAS